MSINCGKMTAIDDALANASEFSSVIFKVFYKNIEYVEWRHEHRGMPYNNDNVIYNCFKNGEPNGEIVRDDKKQRWYFVRANGWAVLPFSIGKYTFSRFKNAYFTDIDKFDRMFVKYMQEALLNMYYVED